MRSYLIGSGKKQVTKMNETQLEALEEFNRLPKEMKEKMLRIAIPPEALINRFGDVDEDD